MWARAAHALLTFRRALPPLPPPLPPPPLARRRCQSPTAIWGGASRATMGVLETLPSRKRPRPGRSALPRTRRSSRQPTRRATSTASSSAPALRRARRVATRRMPTAHRVLGVREASCATARMACVSIKARYLEIGSASTCSLGRLSPHDPAAWSIGTAIASLLGRWGPLHGLLVNCLGSNSCTGAQLTLSGLMWIGRAPSGYTP